jgi:hypothetical protein
MKIKKKNISYITSDFLNDLIIKHGFNINTLSGGDLISAKAEALDLTNSHEFINPRHKLSIIRAINHSYTMIELYTALFNMMHAKTNPQEKLTGIL